MVRTSTSSPDIRQGIDTIYELNADVALREQILARDKAVMDYENDMASARDEGRMEAMLDMARNLLHMKSMSEKDIATATQLPLETIQKLAAQV